MKPFFNLKSKDDDSLEKASLPAEHGTAKYPSYNSRSFDQVRLIYIFRPIL